jgi:type IV pilus assembly protein PilN
MIKINLLSEGKRPAAVRKARTAGLQGSDVGQWLVLVVVLAGILAVAAWWYVLKGRLEDKQKEVAQAQREVDELQDVIKQVEEFKHKKAELERKIKVINDLKLNQRGPVRVMDYISRALPELLWLDRMRMTPQTIELEGRAFNTNAEAAFMENLDKVPEFKEPTLKDTSVQAAGVYKFIIDFDYTFAPPAPKAASTPGAPGNRLPPPGVPGASIPAAPAPAPPGTAGTSGGKPTPSTAAR